MTRLTGQGGVGSAGAHFAAGRLRSAATLALQRIRYQYRTSVSAFETPAYRNQLSPPDAGLSRTVPVPDMTTDTGLRPQIQAEAVKYVHLNTRSMRVTELNEEHRCVGPRMRVRRIRRPS